MSGKKSFCVVIMAGGRGTRFWPLSREKRPKQFLPITSRRTMIEETVERLLPLVSYSSIYTISDGGQARLIKRLLPRLPEKNVLVEPKAKNTAASLILTTASVYLRNPRTVVAALCADHLISKRDVFLRKLEASAEAAAKEEVIITFGIPPTYPATGYGYIEISRHKVQNFRGERFYPVVRFKEKPGLKQAKEFASDGRHYWNSGMFIWRADVFGRKLERYAPEFFPYWKRILRGLKEKDDRILRAVFREIPATSIDYALMEKAEGVLMTRGDFGWSDVGSWSALAEIWTRDEANNALHGESLVIDSSSCLLYSPRKLTALIGLQDVIVVDTKDALLVCRRDQDQRVKDIIEALKKRNAKKYL
ncbi:MAG: sugar phosphate nucleotidyltransferase [Clostridiales bacterium]|nr:sugar phosphate nucleotidyltransferase [Clostridiales bacterium]